MADVNVVTKMEDKKSTLPQPMRVIVMGRVEGSKTYDGKRYTQIMTPAADAYSRPQLIEVRSKSRIADKGEEISVACILGGYQRKAYDVKDKKTGEIQTVVPVEHTLDLIEMGD